MAHKFLMHYEEDHVGVAVEDIKAGEVVEGVIMENNRIVSVQSKSDIPLGHKISLTNLKQGENLIKYRLPVGITTQDIEVGDYVHTHNVKTARW